MAAGKPDPEPYVAAANALGVDIAGCVVFEDSPSGGRSGRAAGASVVAIGSQPWDTDPNGRAHSLADIGVETTERRGFVITSTEP